MILSLLPLIFAGFFSSADITLMVVSADPLTSYEQRLDLAFDESTYRRYLYYCRQQNQGERLTEHSARWMEAYGHEVIRFGYGEGLMMQGQDNQGIKEFRSLYDDSPRWGTEIIFTLSELGSAEAAWFIEAERKRSGNPSLHSRLLIGIYLDEGNDRKALDELGKAIGSGSSPSNYTREIDILSQRLGAEKVMDELTRTTPRAQFQMALELGEDKRIEEAINKAETMNDLVMMAQLCEKNGYPKQALLAYRKADRKTDAARMLILLGETDEAAEILAKDNTRRGREQRAFLYAESENTYKDALDELQGLERSYGSKPAWTQQSAALHILMGDIKKANQLLSGIPDDSSGLFLKGVIAVNDQDVDSLKRYLDRSMMNFPGNGLENDLLLLYSIAINNSQSAPRYALALTAYHWGDCNDSYGRSLELSESSEEIADEAMLLAAESLVKLMRYREAEQLYMKIDEKWPTSPLAPRAQYERALLLRDKLNSLKQAEQLLKELLLRNPGSVYADLARREI